MWKAPAPPSRATILWDIAVKEAHPTAGAEYSRRSLHKRAPRRHATGPASTTYLFKRARTSHRWRWTATHPHQSGKGPAQRGQRQQEGGDHRKAHQHHPRAKLGRAEEPQHLLGNRGLRVLDRLLQ